MSDTVTLVTASGAGPRGRRRGAAAPRRAAGRHQARYGYIFVSGYTLFLLAFGIFPTLYAVYLSFTKNGQFAGIDNFVKVFNDYRFLPAVGHVALYVFFWLISLLVLVTVLALVVHAVRVRWLSDASRFLFYIPGAIAGASSVLLWLFVLDPSVSPVSGLLHAMGFEKLVNVVAVENLPVVFTVIAFWAGAGGWIVIMYGALNNVPNMITIQPPAPAQKAMTVNTMGRFSTATTLTSFSNPIAWSRPETGLTVGSRTKSHSRTLDAPATAPGM